MQRPGWKRYLFTTYCASRAYRDLLSRGMIFFMLFKDLMSRPSRRLPQRLHPSHNNKGWYSLLQCVHFHIAEQIWWSWVCACNGDVVHFIQISSAFCIEDACSTVYRLLLTLWAWIPLWRKGLGYAVETVVCPEFLKLSIRNKMKKYVVITFFTLFLEIKVC